MKLEIINLLHCPHCDKVDPEGRYEITGDYTQEKIFDGHITCSGGHTWQVRDEILRLHEESEPHQLYDQLDIDEERVPILPEELDESQKKIFNRGLKKLVDGLNEDAYAVTGYLLQFVKALGATEKLFVLFSENEDELRMAQEIVAKNQVYDNFFFVRHHGFALSPLTNIPRISLFSNDDADIKVILSKEDSGDVLVKFADISMIIS